MHAENSFLCYFHEEGVSWKTLMEKALHFN